MNQRSKTRAWAASDGVVIVELVLDTDTFLRATQAAATAGLSLQELLEAKAAEIGANPDISILKIIQTRARTREAAKTQ